MCAAGGFRWRPHSLAPPEMQAITSIWHEWDGWERSDGDILVEDFVSWVEKEAYAADVTEWVQTIINQSTNKKSHTTRDDCTATGARHLNRATSSVNCASISTLPP